MTAARVLTVAEMQGRELLRRRIALGLLVLLPLAFYVTTAGQDDDAFALVAGGIGMAWALAGAALFAVLASRGADPRLVLSGYAPFELLLGRLLLLLVLGLVIVAGFAGVIAVVSRPDVWLLVAGLVLAALIGIPLGLAIAALLPRELEGTMAIIGIVGINMSVAPDAALASVLPFNGPSKLLSAAAGSEYGVLAAVTHGVAYAVALFAVAVARWTRRVRIRSNVATRAT